MIKKEEMHYVAISRKQSYDPCLWDQSEEKTVLLKDGKTELSLKKAKSPKLYSKTMGMIFLAIVALPLIFMRHSEEVSTAR